MVVEGTLRLKARACASQTQVPVVAGCLCCCCRDDTRVSRAALHVMFKVSTVDVVSLLRLFSSYSSTDMARMLMSYGILWVLVLWNCCSSIFLRMSTLLNAIITTVRRT